MNYQFPPPNQGAAPPKGASQFPQLSQQPKQHRLMQPNQLPQQHQQAQHSRHSQHGRHSHIQEPHASRFDFSQIYGIRDSAGQEVNATNVNAANVNAANDQLNATNDQLEDVKSKRSASRNDRRLSIAEKNANEQALENRQRDLEAQKAYLEQELANYEARLRKADQLTNEQGQKIDRLQEKVDKMTATIKIQSETISNPRPGRNFTTPFLPRGNQHPNSYPSHNQGLSPEYANPAGNGRPNQTPAPKSVYAQPPAYTGSGGHAATTNNNQAGAGGPNTFPPRNTCNNGPALYNGNGVVSPTNMRSHRLKQSMTSRASSSTNGRLLTPPASNARPPNTTQNTTREDLDTQRGGSDTQSLANSMALVRISESESGNILMEDINRLFELSRLFAHQHANFLNPVRDRNLPEAVRIRLIRASSRDTYLSLLSSKMTRYLLIAKLIAQWLIKHVLKPTVFRDFNLSINSNIETARNQLYQNTPPNIRYLLLNTIANEIRKLQSNDQFENLFQQLCRDNGNDLFDILKEVMYDNVSRNWDDMFQLMRHAHRLAARLYTTGEEYRFDFPEINDRYLPTTMTNRDGNLLDASDYFIRLSISPQVSVRINKSTGEVVDTKIRNSDVLVKNFKG